MYRKLIALALAGAACAAGAQIFSEQRDPDWKEQEAPPPPALSTRDLVPLEIQRTSMRYGVDPASVTVGADGIVRYVVVAISPSGVVNGMYEGLRCDSAEVKVYAWHSPGGGWVSASDPQWQPVHGNRQQHSLRVARDGACVGRGPNGTAAKIVRDLARGPQDKFVN